MATRARACVAPSASPFSKSPSIWPIWLVTWAKHTTSCPRAAAVMLKLLKIKNIAVIAGVELEFGPGLNALTGETGAGKSILIVALGLLLGDRASPELIRTGEPQATVEALVESADATTS